MAYVYSNFASDFSRLHFYDLLRESPLSFRGDANVTYQGRDYEDFLVFTHRSSVVYAAGTQYASLGGTGISYDAQTGEVTSGSITGLINETDSPDLDGTPFWGIQDFSFDAVQFFDVIQTPSWEDDEIILRAILAGSDTFHLSSYDDVAQGFGGDDTMLGYEGSDRLDGGEGADLLDGGEGIDVLYGTVGGDTLIGGSGDDHYHVRSDATIIELPSDGIDAVHAYGSYALGENLENLSLDIFADNASAYGNLLNNSITGNLFNNLIDGGGGNDTMEGRGGSDTYIVDSPFDIVIGVYHASYSDEIETIRSSISWSIDHSIENLVLIGSDAIDATGNDFANELVGNDAANCISGLGGNDLIGGNGGDDLLIGGAGDDVITSGSGSDTVVGGAGNDSIVGNGWTLLSHENSSGAVNVNLGSGVVFDGDGGRDSVSGVSGVVGSNAGADTLIGGASDDFFAGLSGNDSINGAAGFDTAQYYDASTGVVANLQTGQVYSISSAFGADLVTDVEAIDGSVYGDRLIGNSVDNSLSGETGNDSLYGGVGIDTLRGGAGNDSLSGGLGDDSMVGGIGNDIYVVDSVADIVIEIYTVSSEIDTVQSSVSRTLETYVENLTLTGADAIDGNGNNLINILTGNAAANRLSAANGNDILSGGDGNDTLIGGAGADSLNGGAGADSMTGGTGNDSYVVDSASDVVIETYTVTNEIDTVQSSVTRTLETYVERLTLTGSAAINGTGNNLANVITGNLMANVLSGGNGNDSVYGGVGNDSLLGGSGNDLLSGSAGQDTFRFNTALNATTNVDTLIDFTAADDRIDLDDAFFAGVGPTGALSAGAFHAGSAAAAADDRIIYNAATGQLLFDADGDGSGAAVLFATVAVNATVSAVDFWVV